MSTDYCRIRSNVKCWNNLFSLNYPLSRARDLSFRNSWHASEIPVALARNRGYTSRPRPRPTNQQQQSRYTLIPVAYSHSNTNILEDGPSKEARHDRQEAHQALQPPSVRPLQVRRPKLEEAKGYRQCRSETFPRHCRHAKGALK